MKLVSFLFAGLAFAQSIEPPTAGYALDRDGHLRPVYGVAGNFVVGSPVVDGERVVEEGAEIAVRRGNGVSIVRRDGAVVDSLPLATGAVLILSSGVVFVAGDDLVLRRADASQTRLPLAGVIWLRIMGADYIQAATADAMYALRITAGREALFVLPLPTAREHRR